MDQSVEAAAKVRAELERWIGGFHWDWFVTLTVRREHNRSQMVSAAQQLLGHWSDAYAFVAIERGDGGRLHCHPLIGGIGNDLRARAKLIDCWNRGIITVDRFKPERKGIQYLLKQAAFDPEALE